MKKLPFNRIERTTLTKDAQGDVRIDIQKLTAEMSHYDADVQERLRRAALRAIDEELARIRAERERPE